MPDTQTFTATIEDAGSSGGAYVTIPFDLEEVFGKKRMKARVTFDGELYRGTIGRYGGTYMVIVRKDIREAIGKEPGDEVEVTIEEDTEPRVVEVPADVKAALAAEPEAEAFFDDLSFTHKKEYVQWVEEAKREETRERRIGKMIEMLLEGKKTRY